MVRDVNDVVSRFSRVSGLLHYVTIAFGEVSEALLSGSGSLRCGLSVQLGVRTLALCYDSLWGCVGCLDSCFGMSAMWLVGSVGCRDSCIMFR